LDWLLNFTHQKDIISSFVALRKLDSDAHPPKSRSNSQKAFEQ
jgi:hypothetical protein